ncbi:MAG: hypothetical protein PF487_13915 [Bacteroidales bacterium]|jgi:tetratricopeptide (TPR) repeat protein|nr:hypothetical protein [Bacteroidales bacterium]
MIIQIIKILIWPFVCVVGFLIFKEPFSSLISSLTNIVHKTKQGDTTQFQFSSSKTTFSPKMNNIDTSKKQKNLAEQLEKYLDMQDYVSLQQQIKQIKKKDKLNYIPYVYSGRMYIEQRKFDLAKKNLSKGLNLTEKNNELSELYYYLGMIPLKQEALEEAKDLIQKAYSLYKTDPKIFVSLAYIRFYLDNNVNDSLKFISSAHKLYKKESFPKSTDLDITIHQNMEYYLAVRGTKEDFKRAYEIDEYLATILKSAIRDCTIGKEDIAYVLDTRGFLRYKSIEAGFIKDFEKKNNTLNESVDMLLEAVDRLPSDKDITNNLRTALHLYRKNT